VNFIKIGVIDRRDQFNEVSVTTRSYSQDR